MASDPLSVITLRDLIERDEELWNAEWSHDVCTAGRFVHIDVWTRFLGKDYVESTVIPLLEKAKEKLLKFKSHEGLSPNDIARIKVYIENNARRTKNIRENYLKAKPSAFTPEDKISELKKKHG